MSRLSISLLGTFQVSLDDKPVTTFESDKVRALLAYLAVESAQPQRRQTLAGLLWPERPERNARQNLSQALFNLRQAIGDRDATPPYLLITPQTLQFNQHSIHDLDTNRLAELLVACQEHRHPQLAGCHACLDRLRQAAKLYRGSFLEGFSLKDSPAFEEWVLLEQERFQRKYVKILRYLADSYEQRCEYEPAIQVSQRWAALEPWQEEAHRKLMALLALSEQSAAALRQYELCRRSLATELGVEPEPATTALYEFIRDGAALTPTATGPPHNLPVMLTPFVGRARELAQIGEHLQNPACRLLTLVGPGGIGKTFLAVQAAAGQLTHFADGVFFISLAQLQNVAEIAPAVARTLDLSFYTDSEGGTQVDLHRQLLDYLRPRRMLLILDNFEHLLAEGVAWVVDLLKNAPAVTLLVTSRARLKVQGEQLLPVTGMALPDKGQTAVDCDAIKLFRQSARRLQPAFEVTATNLADVVRICRTVRGNPLAILLAATWVQVLSPAEIGTEISHSLDFLETDWPDVPKRHRSVRTVIDHSWQLLTAREQQIFLALSVFQGGFTSRAAAEVADAPLAALVALTNNSFLQNTGAGRYELHDLLRQYGAEKLEQMPGAGEAAHDRHCAYYIAALQAWGGQLRGSRQQIALKELDEEIENARTAWNWAVARGQAARLDQALDGLCLYYQWRGRYREGEIACGQAVERLAAVVTGEAQRVLARLLIWQGTLVAFSQGRPYLNQGLLLLGQPAPATNVGLTFGLAAQIGQQLLYRLWPGWSVGRLASRQATLLAAARGYERLMAVCYFANDTGLTLYAVFRSLNLAEAAGLSPELARGYASVGMITGLIPLHRMAEAYFRRAMEASQAVDDFSVQIWVSLVAGVYYAGVGSWAKAETLLTQSINLAEQMGDRYRWDDGVGNMAAIVYLQGDFAATMELSDDFYRSASSRHDAHNQGWALRGRVYGLLPQGKLSEALTSLEELNSLLTEDPDMDESLKIDLHGLLALVHLRRNKPHLALAAAEESVKLMARTRPSSFLSLPGYAGVAETYLTLWAVETSPETSNRIHPKATRSSNGREAKSLKSGAKQACKALRGYAQIFPIGQPRAYLWRGTYQWLSGRANAARKLWAAGLTAAGALAMPYDQGLIHLEIGKHCPTSDPARARHLTIACDIFERLKASYDLARAREALRFENQVGRRCRAGGLFDNSAAKPKL